MSNIAELFIRATKEVHTSEQMAHARKEAENWATKARDITASTPCSPESDAATLCNTALAATLFQLGMLREMDNEPHKAKAFFEESLQQARKIGLKEGVVEAIVALRRIKRAIGTQEKTSTQDSNTNASKSAA
jgi:hypothetical protein